MRSQDKRKIVEPERTTYDVLGNPSSRRILQEDKKDKCLHFSTQLDNMVVHSPNDRSSVPNEQASAGGSGAGNATVGGSQGRSTQINPPSIENLNTREIKIEDLLPLIPEFSGRRAEYKALQLTNNAPAEYVSPRKFLNSIENLVQQSDRVKILIALKKSVGQAHQSVQRCVSRDHNWVKFKDSFSSIYELESDRDLLNNLNEFRNSGRKKGESYLAWYMRVYETASEINDADKSFNIESEMKDLVMRFTPSRIWDEVKEKNDSWTRVVELDRKIRYDNSLGIPELAECDEYFGRQTQQAQINVIRQGDSELIEMKRMIVDLSDKLAKIGNEVDKKNSPAPMPMTNNKRTYQNSKASPITCFSCKKRGHISRDCRSKRLCYSCNKPGHIAKFCRVPKFRPQSYPQQHNDTAMYDHQTKYRLNPNAHPFYCMPTPSTNPFHNHAVSKN